MIEIENNESSKFDWRKSMRKAALKVALDTLRDSHDALKKRDSIPWYRFAAKEKLFNEYMNKRYLAYFLLDFSDKFRN